MPSSAGFRLRVHLDEGRIEKEEISEDLRRGYVGGRGFNSKSLFDEVRPGLDPMSPENVFLVGVGPLAGTLAPCGARWTVTAKSPETGIFGDGNGGGDFAAELKLAGYDQVIFHGRSAKPVYLWIKDGQVELRDASHLWGRTTWDTHKLLVRELGDREIRELSVGPAAEHLVRFAKVFANMTRAGGKGGMGTVMGSKNLKAVVVRGTGSVKIVDPKGFSQAVKQAYENIQDSPFQQWYRETGTMFLPRAYIKHRAQPTRNSQAGYFEGWEKLTSEVFEEHYAVKHVACFGCPTACSHFYEVKDGPYVTHGCANQYGTLYPFTFKCGSGNMAASLLLTTLCDQLGLDTHSTGAVIAFAMECWENGLLTAKDTDGLDLSWGNDEAIIELVHKIAYREGFGDVLADGQRAASERIPGSHEYTVLTKGLCPSSYYPGEGESKMVALAYATAPIGGSVHRGGLMGFEGHPRVVEALGDEAARRLLDPTVYEGQALVLAVENDFVAALNAVEACMPLCMDAFYEDDLANLVSTATGIELDGDTLMKVGERIFNVERAFNVREGVRRRDDTLPERFFGEKTTPWGVEGLEKDKFRAMLDEYYRIRGWDADGVPTREKLVELDLGHIADEIGAKSRVDRATDGA
jgi:aldehyde:ferredoxin oxidoreductase